jgi:hypothetical protein
MLSLQALTLRQNQLIIRTEILVTLMNFVVNNQELFQTNSALCSVNIRNRCHLHRPFANLLYLQKSGYYPGIRINSLL